MRRTYTVGDQTGEHVSKRQAGGQAGSENAMGQKRICAYVQHILLGSCGSGNRPAGDGEWREHRG